MKKQLALILAMVMAFSLTACGGGNAATSGNTSTPSSAPATSGAASSAPADSDTTGHPVLQSGEEGTNTINAEDGTVLMNLSYQTFQVKYPAESEAQKAIQADLDQVVTDFKASAKENESAAKEDYKQFLADGGKKEEFHTYSMELTGQPQRQDNGVVSILFSIYQYTGGAHGSLVTFGKNYDAKTGKALTMQDLGDGVGDLAIDNAVKFVNAIQDSDNTIFFDKVTAEDEYVRSMLEEGNFYLSENGLVLIDGEYLLQPYAAGIVEFTTSYDDLAGKLKEEYALTGGVTQSDTTMGIYTFDANGNLVLQPKDTDTTTE